LLSEIEQTKNKIDINSRNEIYRIFLHGMLTSFRFTVEIARKDNANVDRIIYCILFAAIIEQSVNAIRKIVETDKSDKYEIALEHHSNISQTLNNTEEEFNPSDELYMQSWDIKCTDFRGSVWTQNYRHKETSSIGKFNNYF
jgi:hypothetical protein